MQYDEDCGTLVAPLRHHTSDLPREGRRGEEGERRGEEEGLGEDLGTMVINETDEDSTIKRGWKK